MKLLVTGGTGFIGTPLCRSLGQAGHELLVLTRTPGRFTPQPHLRFLAWEGGEWPRAVARLDGIINLAGESIAAKRWTPRQKARIRDSRVETTRRLVDVLAASSSRPSVLVSASAIGYYGPQGDEELSETTAPGSDFLAQTCRLWEAQAQRAEGLGVRVVRLRIGIVLGRGGGALAKLVAPFQWFVGGPLGTGRQWMSWISLEDLVGLMVWALANPAVSGAVNATAPNPARMREFCRELGRVLARPSWAPVPGVMLRLLVGEMAQILLTGQRVVPTAALRAGYPFRFPALREALDACLQ